MSIGHFGDDFTCHMTQPTASQHQRTMASQPDQGPIQPTASQHRRTMASQPDQGPIQPTASQHRRTMASQPDQGPIHVTVFKLMFKSPKKNDKTSRNYLYFTCHQYDNRYIKKTISVSRHF